MRLLVSGARVPAARRWLAVGIVSAASIGGVAGGSWYAAAQEPPASLRDSLTSRASAQEIAATARQSTSPATARPDTPPAAGNAKRPTGHITQITAEPAAFTIQSPAGDLTTYRVLDTTVFMAGRDRPYRFDLLKTGDTVVIRSGGQGQKQAATRLLGNGASNGELVARQVLVRPAGERKPVAGTHAQNGGSDAAGQ